MRTRIILVIAFLWCSACVAQTQVEARQTQPDPEGTVAILLGDNGQAPIPGFVDTLVRRLGDGAAVGVIQYLGRRKTTVSRDPTSTEEIKRILLIIRMAFDTPNIIESMEDRSPKATLILLQYLSGLPAAGPVREDIRATGDMVEKLKATLQPPK
jgi:hypothetical protein